MKQKMRRNSLTLVLAALTLVISMFFNTTKANASDWKTTQVHDALSSESGWLNTSKPLTADDLKGRVILVDFWTFCCINCIHVIPELKDIEHKFGHKITVIGVHSAKFTNEKDSENIRQAILRYGIEHPVVNDGNFGIWQQFGVRAWPTLLLIGADGRIKNSYSGEGNKAEIIDDIEAQLDKGNYREDALPIALEKDKAPASLLKFPSKLAAGKLANEDVLFITNNGSNEILAVNKSGEVLEKYSGNFEQPQGILYSENKLYVADTGNHQLKAIDLTTKKVETLAGTGERGSYSPPRGSATSTDLSSPWDLAFYPNAETIAIANAGSHQIWSYNIKSKELKIVAGNGREFIDDGSYPRNSLSQTSGLSTLGDKLYFVDSETSSLRVLENGEVKTLIGTGLFDFGYKEGKQGQALMQHPLGLLAKGDSVLIADSYNHSIRKYDIKTGELKNLFGNGKRGELNEPNDIKEFAGATYIADTNANKILKIEGDKLVEFKIREKQAEAKPEKADDLPNLIKSDAIEVSKNALSLGLKFKPNWKINELAPTYLRLFHKQKLVSEFDKTALMQRIQLGKLENGEYLLQGTVYYCEGKQGSECLLSSINQKITVSAKSKLDEIIISF